MKSKERLRFFVTLLSVNTTRRQHSSIATLQWLERARESSSKDEDWVNLYEDFLKSTAKQFTSDELMFVDQQVERLLKAEISLVTIADPDYPTSLKLCLGDRAPVFLWFRGNAKLFANKAIGFCGSRHASDRGLEVCGDIVAQLVERNTVIVAGYAAGVDQVAHLTALKHGGYTIAVLAEGILNFGVRRLLAREWDWERTLVVSEFLPQTRWSVGHAMQRNRTIVGLGSALVVIEARETGGTFEAGKEALALGHPLFAPIYDSVEGNVIGNKILIDRGATPVMKSKATGRAKIERMFQSLNESASSTVAQHKLPV